MSGELPLESDVLAVQLLDGGGGVDGERIGVHLQDLGAVGEPFATASNVFREDLGKLLGNDVEVAPVRDVGMRGAIGFGIAEIDEMDLVDLF